jgi:hypothetical protein
MSAIHALAAPCATALDSNSKKATPTTKTLFNMVFSYDLHGNLYHQFRTSGYWSGSSEKEEIFPTSADCTIDPPAGIMP